MAPDPKPEKRKKDPKALKRAHLSTDECAACERSDTPLSAHHVLYGADGRHDEPGNLLMLCGDGVSGCHGGAHHSNHAVLRKIGEAIAARPGMIRFVEERLGVERGRDYLKRRYGLDLDPGGVRTDFKPEKTQKKGRR